jgi:hypothetical protein
MDVQKKGLATKSPGTIYLLFEPNLLVQEDGFLC